MKPFRWNIEKIEQLGRLTSGQRSEAYPEFVGELRRCASRVVGGAGGGRLVFVGRSPESLFDYLSGVFSGTSWDERLVHLNVSNRWSRVSDIEKENPGAVRALEAHFELVGLAPDQIIAERLPTCLVDLVASGSTFGQIAEFLVGWNARGSNDQAALRHKLLVLGITMREQSSPKAWRWFQHADWIEVTGIDAIKNVSIGERLWRYLGNEQAKVTDANTPRRWDDQDILLPPRDTRRIEALRRAADLFRRGVSEKGEFATLLAGEKSMSEAWLRDLVGELRS